MENQRKLNNIDRFRGFYKICVLNFKNATLTLKQESIGRDFLQGCSWFVDTSYKDESSYLSF